MSQTKPGFNKLQKLFLSPKNFDIVRDKGDDKKENFGEFLRR
jgi:hypothetical protein